MEPQPFLCKKGNYRELAAYQKAGQFVADGGIREQMTRARLAYRNGSKG